MSVKKKICFIAQFPPPIHGLSKAVDTLFNSELRNEFDFEKIDIKDNRQILRNLNRIRKSDADLFYFTISQTKGGNLRDLVILKLLEKKHKKCLIHLHGGYYRQLVDNDMSGWQRKANYKAIHQLEGAIVLGDSLKFIFKGMLPDEKIYVVPNCVDDEYLMADDEFEEKMGAIDKRTIKHVLYLSNFIKSKGYPEVLEMAKLEKERVETGGESKLHFDFAGKFFEAAEKDFFFQYIKENDLEEYITYHGVVDGDKKRELLKSCDIFVLLTRYLNEGQPISILEAMGNGMVIVATNHAGIPDIVKDGENGIVVDDSDIKIGKLYDKILKLFESFKNIEIANRSEIKSMYTQKKYSDGIQQVFNSALD